MLGKEMFDIWYEKIPANFREELDAIKDNENEIKERFSVPLAFGTAGMRGEVGLGTYRMNDYTVARATKGLAMFITSLGKEAMERGVVISYDTRRCSLDFAIIVAKALSYAKIKSYIFDTVHPVPMCSYAVRKLNAIAGVMITASHNPKEYNGYKVYGEDGAQMGIEETKIVVKYIDSLTDYFGVELDGIKFPKSIQGLDNVKLNDYITVIGKTVDDAYYAEIEKLSLSPKEVAKMGKTIKLVYTPIHGTGYVPVTTILERMGISVNCVAEQVEPDTEFSTVPAPNPENPKALKMGIELGNKIGADVVIGTDPDCDRMGLAVRDNEGAFRLLNGNQIGALLMDYILTRLKEENNLPKNGAVIKTIVTTTLADRIANDFGVKIIDVLTGFKFIGEKIKEWEKTNEYSFIFGYEESYGYLRGTHARDKDAVVASMLTAEMVCYYESKGIGLYQRLMDIFKRYGYYCEEVTSIAYKGVSAMAEMASAMDKLRNKTITRLDSYEVEYTADYLARLITYPNKQTKEITLPETDAIKYCLIDGQFVCVRPSGTEPKLKVYVLCYDIDMEKAIKKADALLTAIKKEL